MGLGGGHGAVVALAVELLDLVFLCEGAPDAEGAVEGGVVAAVCFFPALH